MLRKILLSVVAVAALVTVFSTTAVQAEWPIPPIPSKPEPAKPETPKPPIDVAKNGSGNWVWKVKGTGTVNLHDVLTTYANSSGIKGLYYDPKVIPNRECYFAAPETGVEYAGEEIGNFVSNLLRVHGLAIVQSSPGQQTISNFNDAVGSARNVDEAELAAAPVYEFVMCTFRLSSADSNSIANALRGLMRSPTYVSPVPGANAVMIGGRAGEVRACGKQITALDRARGDDLTLKRHEVPEGTDPAEVLGAIRQIMPPPAPNTPVFATSTNATFAVAKKGLLVRGSAADHKLVDEVIAQFNGK